MACFIIREPKMLKGETDFQLITVFEEVSSYFVFLLKITTLYVTSLRIVGRQNYYASLSLDEHWLNPKRDSLQQTTMSYD